MFLTATFTLYPYKMYIRNYWRKDISLILIFSSIILALITEAIVYQSETVMTIAHKIPPNMVKKEIFEKVEWAIYGMSF